jgi:deoxyribonuclease V
MSILAVDVHYTEVKAKVVGVLFDWADHAPKKVIQKLIDYVVEYIPGEFYKRELPCILELLKEVELSEVSIIIVDGHVYVDNNGKYGLGAHLYETLDGKFPVIGVAKSSFFNNENTVLPICRGVSTKPLLVSAIGINLNAAAQNVKAMCGNNRMPDILKQLDQITKAKDD